MPRKRRDHILFLEDIATAIRKIEKYASGKGARELGKEEMALDINVESVHDTIANNLPGLKKSIRRALRMEKAAAKIPLPRGERAG